MKTLTVALALAIGLGGQALATTAGDDEGAERIGEIHVTLDNAAYCKVEVNGDEWSSTEFERRGKLLLIKALALTGERYAVTLTPFDPKLAPATFDVGDKDFKKRRKGRYYFFIATKTVRFDKAKDAPSDPVPTPDEPAPKPKPKPDDDDFDL